MLFVEGLSRRGWAKFTCAAGNVGERGRNVALSHEAGRPGHKGLGNCQSASGRCDSRDIHVLRNYRCCDVRALMMYERSVGGWVKVGVSRSHYLVETQSEMNFASFGLSMHATRLGWLKSEGLGGVKPFDVVMEKNVFSILCLM